MPRYIDADALIKKIFPYDGVDRDRYVINAKAVYEAIQKVPTADVVEAVRCKDCEYCEVLEMDYGGKQYWCKFWSMPKREYADAYCCHGERKE